jgi:hypothetical protein
VKHRNGPPGHGYQRGLEVAAEAPDHEAGHGLFAIATVEIAIGIEIDCQYVVHLDSARPGPTHVCRAAKRAGLLLGRRLSVTITVPGAMRDGCVSVVMVPDEVTVVDNARLRERAGMLAGLLVELEGALTRGALTRGVLRPPYPNPASVPGRMGP